MTDTQSTPSPKKSSITKKIFITIAFILIILGVDHLTFNIAGIGADVTIIDTTIVVVPSVDTAKVVATQSVTVVDTTKK